MDMPAVTTVAIAVRYRDIDAMGHVNNAVYAMDIETARATLFAEHLDVALTPAATVPTSLQIDCYTSITRGDRVRVTCAVQRVGRTSLPMTYTICADGNSCVTATTMQVVIEADRDAAAALSEGWRERLF